MHDVDLQSAKAALRNRIRAALKDIPAAASAAASAQVCKRLKEQPFWHEARSVLFFAPLPDELDIWALLSDALTLGKTVALPRFCAATQSYTAARVQDLQRDLQPGQFGIREPRGHCPELPLDRFGLVLVPGMAFDTHGHRLGRGRGFYDRLLRGVRGNKCGVAFDEQIVETVPAGPHDVRVNRLLTPTRLAQTGE